jgi:hypothetical protein
MAMYGKDKNYAGRILARAAGLTGSFRIWLFSIIILLLVFFGIGSAQGFTDANLFFVLTLIRISSFMYLFLTLAYLFMLFFVPRMMIKRILSLLGFLVILPVYLGESYLMAWLEGL